MANTMRRACVLLADDDEDWRCLTARALRALDLDVQEASDGEELLFHLHVLQQYGKGAVVLTDVHMPRTSGLTAWQAARDMALAAPFLFVTGASDSPLAREVRALGGTVIGKSVTPRALAGLVQRFCGDATAPQ